MKLVIQFFDEKKGTRSEPISGTPGEILSSFDHLETSLREQVEEHSKMTDRLSTGPVQEFNQAVQLYDQACDSLDRFLDSFVIVILEQHSDDPDDMRVSRIPILKRENFVTVLKEKAQ
ncbi:MAG: hypothetical protein QXT77_05120 [Candidatus Methanomethylicaceae archaeon]